MNLNNFGVLEGRLTRDPVVRVNRDGSKTIKLTVAAKDNFRDEGGQRGTQFVEVEGYVAPQYEGVGVYGEIHQGDMVGVGFQVRSRMRELGGERVFTQVLRVTDVQLRQTKAAAEAEEVARDRARRRRR